jgi:ABC-type nitrate/sulfonate/bicarbonate transport system substrate-binding protein
MRQDRTMAAAILNPPFAIHARRAGLKDMGPVVATIGRYQGTVPYVLRAWAQAHADILMAYLAAVIDGLRWSLDPSNANEAVTLYRDRLNVPLDIAAEIYAIASDPVHGLARDAVLDHEGFETMLRLRATFERQAPATPERYFDLSYHRRALAAL